MGYLGFKRLQKSIKSEVLNLEYDKPIDNLKIIPIKALNKLKSKKEI